jgi:hypothetical protein
MACRECALLHDRGDPSGTAAVIGADTARNGAFRARLSL